MRYLSSGGRPPILPDGEWAQKDDFGPDTVGIFRPGNGTFYLRFSNSQGNANAQYPYGNSNMLPVAGNFGS